MPMVRRQSLSHGVCVTDDLGISAHQGGRLCWYCDYKHRGYAIVFLCDRVGCQNMVKGKY